MTGSGDYHAVFSTLEKAIAAGAERLSPMKFRWDVSGGCESPHVFDMSGRPTSTDNPALAGARRDMRKALIATGLFPPTNVKGYSWNAGDNHSLWLELTVRCRRCPNCLRARAREWENRAREELRAASRTWFTTYTLRPDEHFRFLSIARNSDRERSVRYEERAEPARFAALCRAISPEITRYVKRVRKQSGARFRYLVVTEAHQSGLPHFHALFHECNPAMPLRKAVLREQWRLGFSHAKLTGGSDTSAARYLCKYLAKDSLARVRASFQYGSTTLVGNIQKPSECVKCDPKKTYFDGSESEPSKGFILSGVSDGISSARL